jgi:hypothetical protein
MNDDDPKTYSIILALEGKSQEKRSCRSWLFLFSVERRASPPGHVGAGRTQMSATPLDLVVPIFHNALHGFRDRLVTIRAFDLTHSLT